MQDGVELTPHLSLFLDCNTLERGVLATLWTHTEVTGERVDTAAKTRDINHVIAGEGMGLRCVMSFPSSWEDRQSQKAAALESRNA
jgi:hypothetical protein